MKALLVDGKVYICDDDGEVTVFRHRSSPKPQMQTVRRNNEIHFEPIPGRFEPEIISEISMSDSIYMTPIVANNVLYIATRSMLFAIKQEK